MAPRWSTLWGRLRAWLPRGGSLPDASWRTRHRGIVWLAALHVPVLAAIAAGQGAHASTWSGVAVVGLLALGAARLPAGHSVLSSLATLSLLSSTALLIHLFDGLIELHFHFFVVIAVVAVYQAWTPYLLAIGFVLAHHAVMGLLMPMNVYNHPAAAAHPVLFAMVHGAFVLAASVACLAYWKITEQALDREREQRELAERSREALGIAHREISDLMAMVSHDFRAPLTVITGHSELVLDAWDDLDDAGRRDLVGRIGGAGRSLEELLASTLTLSTLDAEGTLPRPDVVRLDRQVLHVLASLAEPLGEVDLSGLEAVTAVVDRVHLQQVVTNLVTNAAKYGAAPYAVSAGVLDGDSVVEVVVSDSGPGVPQEFVPRLFDRYSRSEDARRGRERGTGLGLYIVRRLLHANGGEVTYRARPGGGGDFAVTLPRGPHVLALPSEPRSGEAASPAAYAPGATTA